MFTEDFPLTSKRETSAYLRRARKATIDAMTRFPRFSEGHDFLESTVEILEEMIEEMSE